MLRTAVLFGLLTGILLAIGYIFAGIEGMSFFFILAFALNFFSYWYSDKIVLSMYRAKKVPVSSNPTLHKIVEKLAKEANIPKPRIYLVESSNPNAFATGRSPKHSAVAVTSGLLKILDDDEIEGVLSHEIAHIKARDTLTATVAATIAGAIAYIAQIAWWSSLGDRKRSNAAALPLLILAPLAATLVRLAISRSREYAADYEGAKISKKPLSLASALEKISTEVDRKPLYGNAATSHLFIVNPFKKDAFINLFSTHPSIESRIAKLKGMKF